MRLTFLGILRACLTLILLAVCLRPVFPGIRPSFGLDYSAWHATNVVLVEVSPEDGVFAVVESWKGELQPNERITVPELTPFPGAVQVSLYPRRTDFYAPDVSGISEQIPRQPVGSRMVLFLIRGESSEASPTPSDTKSGEKWRPADLFDEMKASVVWINGGQLYCFQQLENPGPSILETMDTSLQKMKDHVKEINRIQQGLLMVVSIGNSGARAEGLKPYVRSEVYESRQLALYELGKCGPSAVSTIRGMLDDPAFADEAAELIKAFVEAGGEAVGEELNSRLQKDLAFWQATAPSLSQGWWNQDAMPHAPLREKYNQTFQLILGLGRTHYLPASVTAKQLGDLWRSFPQLNDPSGLNQMAEACDKLVNHLLAKQVDISTWGQMRKDSNVVMDSIRQGTRSVSN